MAKRKSRPVLLVAAIITGVQATLTALAATDVLSKDTLTVATAVVGGAALALGFYTQSRTVPLADTAAYKDTNDRMIAGPASPPQVIEGQRVSVVQPPTVA